LEWWRAIIVISYLCLPHKYLAIPATLAPSERVLSVAGLMIAKDRAKLDPANANELGFLHEGSALTRYEERG